MTSTRHPLVTVFFPPPTPMIPRMSLGLEPTVPEGHEGWTPRKDDLSEEGFAYFRDTWLIRGIGIREAKEVIALERTLADVAGRLAVDEAEFEALASALEHGDADELPERLIALAELEPHLSDVPPLEGLELGVSGLVHALSAVGCWPAASCRGHPGDNAWSDHPVVYLAADSHRAAVLQPLVESAECGFNTDPARSRLLMIEGESIEDMMALAELVISTPKTFVRKRAAHRIRLGHSGDQLTLDFGP
jgi:hypothetical protein